MVEIERQEVERREEEVRRRNEDLDEKRRKHRMIQDAVTEQVGFWICSIFKEISRYEDHIDVANWENKMIKCHVKVLKFMNLRY